MLKDDKNLTKSLTETTYLDLPLETFKILDQPEETAEVIDLMSPGPLRDELRGTYDPSQESYEDYLRRQSIPQEERPLTGQTPTQQLFGINRQEVNSGGLIARQAYNTGTIPLLTAGRKAIENFLKVSNLEKFFKPAGSTKTTISSVEQTAVGNLANQYVNKFHGGNWKTANDALGYNPSDGKNNALIQKLKRTFGIKNLDSGFDKAVTFTKKQLAQPLDPKIDKLGKKELKEYILKNVSTKNYNDINFYKAIDKYNTNYFDSNLVATSKDLGLARETIQNSLAWRRGYKFDTLGNVAEEYVPAKDALSFGDTTTKVFSNKNYLKDKIKDQSGFMSTKDIAKIFNIGKPGKSLKSQKEQIDYLTSALNKLKVKSYSVTGSEGKAGIKKYDIQDAAKKIGERYFQNKKIIGLNQTQPKRFQNINRLDKQLDTYFSKIRARLRSVKQGENFPTQQLLGQDDVGHPMSINITGKYPNLFKNSDINKINTLTFQDPIVNQQVLQKTGYESSHDRIFKELNEFVNKKLTYKDIKKIKDLKTEMNNLHDKAVSDVKKAASKEGLIINNKQKGETYSISNPYFKGQEKNIPRLDIKIPNVGETFTSSNMYTNLNKVNPANRVGYIQDVNPNARKLSDLTAEQKLQYEANIADQYSNQLEKIYKKMKFPEEQIEDLKDAFVIGSKEQGTATMVPQNYNTGGSVQRKMYGEGASALLNYLKAGVGNTLKAVGVPFTPLGRVTRMDRALLEKIGLEDDRPLSEIYDPKTTSGRVALEFEAALSGGYKPLSEFITSVIKKQGPKKAVQLLLNLGLPLGTISAVAGPVGQAALLTELGVKTAKTIAEDSQNILSIYDDEDRQQAQENLIKDIKGMADGGRIGYAEAGLVDKLGRGAEAFDPRNLPYYGQKTLKGLGEGVEMAVKFPVAAGSAIGTMIQEGPSKEIYQEFMNAMEPTATEYLSRKTGLTKMIEDNEKRLMKERPGAVTAGNVLEFGSTFVPPATGYIKLIEDTGSNLYKVLRNSAFGKPTDEKIVQQVADELSNLGIARRDFLKITGGASIYGLAKYLGLPTAVKIAEKVKPIRILGKSSSRMPEWLPSFASKILDDTDSVFKQIDEDLVEITNKNLPDVSIGKYSNGRWEISGYNEYGKPYIIDYEPPSILEDGTKYAGDFSVFDNVPSRVGPDDVEFDSELVESIDDVLGGTSKLEEWTTGAKKKDLTPGEKRVIEAEGRAEAEYDAWKESEDFVDE